MNLHSINALAGDPVAAQFASQVQQLQTQSPQEFHAILTQLTGQLDKASGDPASTAQPSQPAAPGGHHHHGGGHHCSGSSQSNPYDPFQSAAATDPANQTLAASLFGSITPAQNGLQSLWG